MNLHVWTPDSGTVELPRVHRGIPLAEAPTSEMWLLDLRPSVPRRYERPTGACAPVFRILARPRPTPRRGTRATFWPLAISAGVMLALLVLTYVQASRRSRRCDQ